MTSTAFRAPGSQNATRSLDSVLAGLTVLSMAGQGVPITAGGSTILLPYVWITGPLLVANILIGLLVGRVTLSRPARILVRAGALLSACMAAPLVVSSSTLQLSGWLSMVIGSFSGVGIAIVWSQARPRVGFLDLSAFAFVVTTCAQLLARLAAAGSISDFHRASVISWGGSNYVGGVLVVASLLVLGRCRALSLPGIVLIIPVVGMICAVLTLSRGSTLAASVGLAVFLLSKVRPGKAGFRKKVAPLFIIVLPIVCVKVFERIIQFRSVGGYDPLANNKARIDLFSSAWEQFKSSPLMGTGWYAMRDVLIPGGVESFAHNFVLSFLQIAGLFGAVAVLIILYLTMRGFWARSSYVGASAAVLVVASLDPFLEGAQGSLVGWLAIGMAWFAIPTARADQPRAASVPSDLSPTRDSLS